MWVVDAESAGGTRAGPTGGLDERALQQRGLGGQFGLGHVAGTTQPFVHRDARHHYDDGDLFAPTRVDSSGRFVPSATKN